MTRLFIELYLDEDVDAMIAILLRHRGFAVMTTLEAQHLQAQDTEQLAYAAQHSLTFFTHNRLHFEALATEYIQTQQPHAGIIIATRRRPHELVRRLLSILNGVTADEMENQLRYI